MDLLCTEAAPWWRACHRQWIYLGQRQPRDGGRAPLDLENGFGWRQDCEAALPQRAYPEIGHGAALRWRACLRSCGLAEPLGWSCGLAEPLGWSSRHHCTISDKIINFTCLIVGKRGYFSTTCLWQKVHFWYFVTHQISSEKIWQKPKTVFNILSKCCFQGICLFNISKYLVAGKSWQVSGLNIS